MLWCQCAHFPAGRSPKTRNSCYRSVIALKLWRTFGPRAMVGRHVWTEFCASMSASTVRAANQPKLGGQADKHRRVNLLCFVGILRAAVCRLPSAIGGSRSFKQSRARIESIGGMPLALSMTIANRISYLTFFSWAGFRMRPVRGSSTIPTTGSREKRRINLRWRQDQQRHWVCLA